MVMVKVDGDGVQTRVGARVCYKRDGVRVGVSYSWGKGWGSKSLGEGLGSDKSFELWFSLE